MSSVRVTTGALGARSAIDAVENLIVKKRNVLATRLPRDLQTVLAVDEETVVFRRHETDLVEHALGADGGIDRAFDFPNLGVLAVMSVLLKPGGALEP